jgi:hypothetical protein
MGLRDRLITTFDPLRNAVIPAWPTGYDNFSPYAFLANGQSFPLDLNFTMPGSREEDIENSFEGYVSRAFKGNPVAFACELTRLMIFSEARFQFRSFTKGRPGNLFGDPSLAILEHPFGPNSATGDLLTRALADADHAGNCYLTRRRTRTSDRIVRMRPSWVTMVFGSNDPAVSPDELDAEFLGIIYYPGGEYSPTGDPVYLQRSEIAHFAPIPDPTARGRGMSWITPIVREIMADGAASTHKLGFFEHGGTPNLAIVRTDAPDKEAFDKWRTIITSGHSGVANQYKWLFLTAGATPVPLGKDMQQLDFKVVQGAGETRIAAAAGVHPVVVGLSEGMQGSSLNAGNFNSARRITADKTFRPLWRNFAGSMETLVPPPAGSQLWYDGRDIAFLREDNKDAAEIQQTKAATIRQLVDAGYKPETVVAAVEAEDMSLLKHSGLFSVQLQPAGSSPTPAIAPTNGKAPTPTGGAAT